jgi:hypothetical protein
MNLFAKKITTVKADPYREMRDTINSAIGTAQRNGVSADAILNHLIDVTEGMRRIAHAQREMRQYNPLPQTYDAETLKPINSHAQMAKAEEKRIAAKLKADQAEYQRDLEKRAEREKWTR